MINPTVLLLPYSVPLSNLPSISDLLASVQSLNTIQNPVPNVAFSRFYLNLIAGYFLKVFSFSLLN